MDGKHLYDLYKKGSTPQNGIKNFETSKKKIICFSSPFDESAVKFLKGLILQLIKLHLLKIIIFQ